MILMCSQLPEQFAVTWTLFAVCWQSLNASNTSSISITKNFSFSLNAEQLYQVFTVPWTLFNVFGQSLNRANTSLGFSKLVFFPQNAEQLHLTFTVPWTVHSSLSTVCCVLAVSESSEHKLHFSKLVFLFPWTPNNFIKWSLFPEQSSVPWTQFNVFRQSLNTAITSFVFSNLSVYFPERWTTFSDFIVPWTVRSSLNTVCSVWEVSEGRENKLHVFTHCLSFSLNTEQLYLMFTVPWTSVQGTVNI